jgi:hypothetical protein
LSVKNKACNKLELAQLKVELKRGNTSLKAHYPRGAAEPGTSTYTREETLHIRWISPKCSIDTVPELIYAGKEITREV